MIKPSETETKIHMSSVQQTTTHSGSELHKLLDANLSLPPENHQGFTNHLPMALHAMYSLGATADQLRRFSAEYLLGFQIEGSPSCELRVPSQTPDWLELLGKNDAFPALLDYFKRVVTHDGIENTLQMAMPKLMSGVATAAFHGVIRTAHALQTGHSGEMAIALAYWAWRWQPIRSPAYVEPTVEFDRWTRQLKQLDPGLYSNDQLISTSMNEARHTKSFLEIAGALKPALSLEMRIAELAEIAVESYLARPNFTTLHMITGLRAIRILLPWIADSEASQNDVVHSVVAAYFVAWGTTTVPVNALKMKSWSEVTRDAIASNDEHIVKLVHACKDEASVYGEGRFLLAATMATTTQKPVTVE